MSLAAHPLEHVSEPGSRTTAALLPRIPVRAGSGPRLRWPTLVRLTLLLLLVTGVALFFLLDLHQHLSLDELQARQAQWLAWSRDHALATLLGFTGLYIATAALALPTTIVLGLTAGLLWGPIWGTVIVDLSATVGATLAALLSRYLLRDWLETRLGPRAAVIQAGIARHGLAYLLFVRFVAFFPFWLVNLTLGLTRLSKRRIVLGTALGVLPVTIALTWAGSRLGTVAHPRELLTPTLWLPFLLLGLLTLVPVIIREVRRRH